MKMNLLKFYLQLYRRYIKILGIKGVVLLTKLCFIKTSMIVSIKLKGYLEPIYLRTKTTDRAIFTQIFVDKEYDFSHSKFNPRTIVDGGANVGLFSLYFAHLYPEANIYAIEPEESNFRALAKNTANYKRIFPIYAALWYKNCDLYVKNEGFDKWAIQVSEEQNERNERISGLTIEEILNKYAKSDNIDILKLDVEGSEKKLFECNYGSWLNKVDTIIIELHDRFEPGCSEVFFKAAKSSNFQIIKQKGETVLLERLKG